MPAYSHPYADARDQFYQAYGCAMMAWSALEEVLFKWFWSATALDQTKARAIFYSARSFGGRRDMLAAIIPLADFDDATKEFLKAALKKAAQFSSFRNAAAHGAEGVKDEEAVLPTFVLADPQLSDPLPEGAGFNVQQIMTAAENFDLLRRYLCFVHPNCWYPTSRPEECLELVRALPNQAHSTETNHSS